MTHHRLTCLHESFHCVAARINNIATRQIVVAPPGEVIEGTRRCQGITRLGIDHSQLPRLGAPAAISLLAGPLGERYCGGVDWMAGGQSDFALAAEALKYTEVSYSELVKQTEQLIDEWYGLASRLADFLEAHGSLNSTQIHRLCSPSSR
jgi:hypothetical protein